jgi:adenylate cyclase
MGGHLFENGGYSDWLTAAMSAAGKDTVPTIPVSKSLFPASPSPLDLNAYLEALSRTASTSTTPIPSSNIARAIIGSQNRLPGLSSAPGSPPRFNLAYIAKIVERSNRRIEVLGDRVGGITTGRVMPDRDDITIGTGRQFHLAIMFLDICGFSSRPNWWFEDQKKEVALMNIFMAEMLSIVKDFDGTYEKNTGDGLMAYFGENEKSVGASVKPVAEAALVMHYVNDNLITPWLKGQGTPPVVFRIGVDYGPVTIARVGIHGQESSLVAVGTPANIASKLMNRIPNGGVCIGDEVRKALPHNWTSRCQQCSQDSGFLYTKDGSSYTAWELNHRLSPPDL